MATHFGVSPEVRMTLYQRIARLPPFVQYLVMMLGVALGIALGTLVIEWVRSA